jgi:hypothetical protein
MTINTVDLIVNLKGLDTCRTGHGIISPFQGIEFNEKRPGSKPGLFWSLRGYEPQAAIKAERTFSLVWVRMKHPYL